MREEEESIHTAICLCHLCLQFSLFKFLYVLSFLYGIRAMNGGKGFVIEIQSPYYVDPSDGPRVVITSVIFNGKNYDL